MTYALGTPQSLAGKVIAVTAADQGYGRIVSTALARAGASLVLIGNNSETLASAASTIELLGGEAIPLKADVTVPLDFVSAQSRITQIFGALHGVVHVADKRASVSFTSMSEGEWMELFNGNVKSSVGIAQIIARRLPGTWLTIIGPHLEDRSLQVYPQRGALRGLVEKAQQEDMRVNMVLPERASTGEEALDAPVAEAVLALAVTRLRGNVLEIPLEAAPKLRLPDVPYL
ncbi:SDR family NAD(P)-dependent oxidoreductase [Deinococcus sp.]|uniref:SDR family NAD(P)-dependent oxidoreductase n=1 Tax=Deinococcus sp. TaxID=47478 RepID=UPI0025B9D19B|nr:SDR family NAD(P)-dependent oxidoreductase [Deinococcus sp.]